MKMVKTSFGHVAFMQASMMWHADIVTQRGVLFWKATATFDFSIAIAWASYILMWK